ncbi:hypothetical protein [Streptomyces sp. ODS28]|uniref:antibiotic biosynthesis monooxygenase family protein n=1 Tax=Streptomyces sp. ODS28 TaxID=3136688 RepID=UPI0031EA8749
MNAPRTAKPASIRRTPWQPGPLAVSACEGPPLVSVTEFAAHRLPAALSALVGGLRLRRTWPGTPGALGMWLWIDTDPRSLRSGSVTVWRDERALRAFVARADHRRVAARHRGRGVLRSGSWRPEGTFSRSAAWAAAEAVLTGAAGWPDGAAPVPFEPAPSE